MPRSFSMTFIIDAHEDIAYNALAFGRDYRRSVKETRRIEKDKFIPPEVGDTLLGWPEHQSAQVAAIFATIFIVPKRHQDGKWEEGQAYASPAEARPLIQSQFDYYHDLCEGDADKFRLVLNQPDFKEILRPWDDSPAQYPEVTHPIGLIMLMEGAEGIQSPQALEEWWDAGVRLVGPVWAGGRFCGGTREHGAFTGEGYELLDVMAELGFVLDISHMDTKSSLQALDYYQGKVIASHANARVLLKEDPYERQLSDEAIRKLIDRGGVMGVIPFNRFLVAGWQDADGRQGITLEMVASHIDHICQLAGNAQHAGLGTDFDGGVGLPHVPMEIDSIADITKLIPLLEARDYTSEDINAIMNGNWRQFMESALPL
jgi:membrane dipeptidase